MGSFISSARIRLSVDMWATGRSRAFLPERSTKALAPGRGGKELQLLLAQPVLFEVHQLIGDAPLLEEALRLEHIRVSV